MVKFFKGIWQWLKGLFAAADDTFVGVFRFADRIERAVDKSRQLLNEFKTFDFNPAFKTRVVSVPRAIEGFQELFDTVRTDLLDKFEQLHREFNYWRDKFESRTPSEGAEAASAVTAKLQDLHTMLEQIGTTLETIIDIESIVINIKQRIETLDDLFLPQDSVRTRGDFRYSKRSA